MEAREKNREVMNTFNSLVSADTLKNSRLHRRKNLLTLRNKNPKKSSELSRL